MQHCLATLPGITISLHMRDFTEGGDLSERGGTLFSGILITDPSQAHIHPSQKKRNTFAP